MTTKSLFSIGLLVHLCITIRTTLAQGCTGSTARFPAPSNGRCLEFTKGDYEYPKDFGEVLSKVRVYKCQSIGKRVIISNGIPDHNIKIANPSYPCETNYAVELPLDPMIAAEKTEIPVRGMVAMAINGVPTFGPQEVSDENAVEPTGSLQDAQFWYGHASKQRNWHVHNPHMGKEFADENTFLGYAMDGFPMYGPLDSDEDLDDCNGMDVGGSYRYHVRSKEQVDGNADYCKSDTDPANNWNYILGCYSGSIDNSEVFDSTDYELDENCELEYGEEDPDEENPDSEDPNEENPDSEDPNEENPDSEDPNEEDPDGEEPGVDEVLDTFLELLLAFMNFLLSLLGVDGTER